MMVTVIHQCEVVSKLRNWNTFKISYEDPRLLSLLLPLYRAGVRGSILRREGGAPFAPYPLFGIFLNLIRFQLKILMLN